MAMHTIFVVKETSPGERRVSLIPQDVNKLHHLGYNLYVEKDAGALSGYSNNDYINAGATIRENDGDYRALLSDISIVARAKRPDKSREKVETLAMKPGTILIGALDPFEDDGHVEGYQKASILAYSLDQLPLPINSHMNILASMSKIAGELALEDALEKSNLSNPSNLLVVGAGIAGIAALTKGVEKGLNSTAVITGAKKKKQISHLDIAMIVIEKNAPIEQQQSEILEAAKESDIIITSARSPGTPAPLLFPNKTLALMKAGSCIVDLAISEGGNVEGSQHDRTLELGNAIVVTNVSGYPKIKPKEASPLWSRATRLFIEALATPSEQTLLSKSLITLNKNDY